MTSETVIDVLKILAPIAVSYIALLKTRTDLDRYIARQRSRETGKPVESQMRKHWYHKLYKERPWKPKL